MPLERKSCGIFLSLDYEENYFQKYEILVDIMKLKGGFTEMFDLKTLRTKSIL